jgi:hypothetical protein
MTYFHADSTFNESGSTNGEQGQTMHGVVVESHIVKGWWCVCVNGKVRAVFPHMADAQIYLVCLFDKNMVDSATLVSGLRL